MTIPSTPTVAPFGPPGGAGEGAAEDIDDSDHDTFIENVAGGNVPGDIDLNAVSIALAKHNVALQAVDIPVAINMRQANAEANFQKVVDTGVCEARGAIGSRFNEDLKKDSVLKTDYTAIKSLQGRLQFRLEWAKRKLEELQVSRTKEKKYQKVDLSKGKYMSFGTLVESFGIHYDRKRAIELATRHAMRCIEMGGKWIRKDEMADDLQYMKVLQEHADIFTEAWSLREQEVTSKQLPKSSDGPILAANPEPATPIPIGKKRNPEPSDPSSSAPKKKSKLDETMVSVRKVKDKYNATFSSARKLCDIIEHQAAWKWARTEESLGQLKRALASAEDFLDEDLQRFILEDGKDLKNNLGADTLLKTAVRFLSLDGKLDTIQAKKAKLLASHKILAT
jgi:hypothetical protein